MAAVLVERIRVRAVDDSREAILVIYDETESGSPVRRVALDSGEECEEISPDQWRVKQTGKVFK